MRSGSAIAVLAVWLALAGPAVAGEARCPTAPRQRVTLPAVSAAVRLGEPVTIVALGSSSTEGSGASGPAQTYPARLQDALRAAWPGVAVTVLNRGVGGQDVDEMLARLDRDVLAAHPALVIWQVGANAALRHMDIAAFHASLDVGVQRIVAGGSDLVLMDNQRAPELLNADPGQAYGTITAQAATRWHISLFSRSALMRAWQEADGSLRVMIGADGLHQTDTGYGCLAEALSRTIVAAVRREAAGQVMATGSLRR